MLFGRTLQGKQRANEVLMRKLVMTTQCVDRPKPRAVSLLSLDQQLATATSAAARMPLSAVGAKRH
jgi:hypothetical protein